MTPFRNPEVEAKFAAYPANARKALLGLRELIFETARATPGVGEIEETLKWGEPSYVTPNRAGSTVRIDWKAKDPTHFAMYFHCQTGLVSTFREMFPNDFEFEGNRALIFKLGERVPRDSLAACIAASLIFHLRRKAKPASKANSGR